MIFIATIIVVVLGWQIFSDKSADVKKDEVPFVDTKILGNSKDLVSFSVEPGQVVEGVLTVVGSVQGGYFFEGNILINILDSKKELLRAGNGNAKSDWMTTEPVGFDAILDFTKLPKGLAFIEIQNDDPSDGEGGPAKKILIPIIIK